VAEELARVGSAARLGLQGRRQVGADPAGRHERVRAAVDEREQIAARRRRVDVAVPADAQIVEAGGADERGQPAGPQPISTTRAPGAKSTSDR
jgi:hypothetical protein